ncbi:MAG: hypothetical protein OXH15_18510 [Gammaproteobacteria bacterium]|nr:hypothetical protein [Gammaproteobacteria bacterium]
MAISTIIRGAVAALAVAAVPILASEDAEPASMKTSWGVPDLQGTWDFRTMTPMNRPERFKDKEFLTEEEVAELEENTRKGHEAALAREASDEPSQGDVDVGYDFIFIDVGTKVTGTRRTSLIVDPPNGRRPALTMFARMRQAENRAVWEKRPITARDRPPATRCLVGFNSGPPMSSGAYNNMMRVVQSPGYVAILNEMVNDHRVIPTDGSEHVPDNVRLWKGDSRGRWEGDTLVVETRNFRPETSFSGSGPNMILTERFTRIDADALRYEYTVDDPESFEGKWSTVQDMRRTDDEIYEYACHEGNRAMHLMLAGARKEERDGKPDAEGWLPSWYRGLPRKEELLKQSGEGEE